MKNYTYQALIQIIEAARANGASRVVVEGVLAVDFAPRLTPEESAPIVPTAEVPQRVGAAPGPEPAPASDQDGDQQADELDVAHL